MKWGRNGGENGGGAAVSKSGGGENGSGDVMAQLYLCEEPYWSKYDRAEADVCAQAIEINVISDGKWIIKFERGVKI